MEEKIKEVQDWRDAQQKQLDEDTKGMSSIERVHGALQLTHIDGILKGLDIALRILRKPVEEVELDTKSVEKCKHYDCAQGRNWCTTTLNPDRKCKGVCKHYEE